MKLLLLWKTIYKVIYVELEWYTFCLFAIVVNNLLASAHK
jgi:hypothetical protein